MVDYYSDPLYMRRRIFRIVIYLVLALVIIFGVMRLIEYLNDGYLLVETGGSNRVSVVQVNGSSDNESTLINIPPNSLVELPHGTYAVTVDKGASLTKQIVLVYARKTSKTAISFVPMLQMNPTTSLSVTSLEASPTSLQFIDSNSANLESINQSNVLSTLNSTFKFSSVQWASPRFAVAQTTTGSLYVFSDGSFQQLNIPSSVSNSGLTYAVAPNQMIYLGSDGVVYSGGQSGFMKIFNIHKNTPVYLAASEDAVAVGWSSKSSLSVAIVSNQGKLIAESQTSASGFKWSPDGKKLVAAGENFGEIYTSNLKQIAIIPSYNVVDPVWLNNSVLVYASGNQVWSYNVTNMRSTVLSENGNHTVNGLNLSTDGAYLYVSVVGATNNPSASTVWRIGLAGQAISQTAIQLSKHLPWIFGFCSLGYINFSAPVLLIQSFIAPTPATCSSGPQYLNQFGINVTNLGVDNSSILTGVN